MEKEDKSVEKHLIFNDKSEIRIIERQPEINVWSDQLRKKRKIREEELER